MPCGLSNFSQIASDACSALLSLCLPEPCVSINRKSYKIIRLLGEGGFSFVYLVHESSSGNLFALKKIRCPYGDVADAMREVDSYRMFNHKSLIQCVDFSTNQERDGSKSLYILLPYYRRGNLQDAINSNLINRTAFPEKDLLILFKGVALALLELHEYRISPLPVEEDESNASSRPLMSNTNEGDLVPYAHRDLKPGNIMIGDDGTTPIVMDFGSLVPARVTISNRRQALELQDMAAEQSTMSYRAPELFDAKTGMEVNEKVDVWSLGACLFACMFGFSPFETEGASIPLAVMNGAWKFPEARAGEYSEDAKMVVRCCLTVDPSARPDIREVLRLIDTALELHQPH